MVCPEMARPKSEEDSDFENLSFPEGAGSAASLAINCFGADRVDHTSIKLSSSHKYFSHRWDETSQGSKVLAFNVLVSAGLLISSVGCSVLFKVVLLLLKISCAILPICTIR